MGEIAIPELIFYIISGLLTVVGGLIVWSYAKFEHKVDNLETKVDSLVQAIHKMALQNKDDHAVVQSNLATINTKLDAYKERIENLENDFE